MLLLHERDVLHAGMRRQIGDGTSTNVWTNPWLPNVDLSFQSLRITLVLEFMIQQGHWNLPLLHDLFPHVIVEQILALLISGNIRSDRWISGADKKSLFLSQVCLPCCKKQSAQC